MQNYANDKLFVECFQTLEQKKPKATLISYIETMFIDLKQGTKHPEAGP